MPFSKIIINRAKSAYLQSRVKLYNQRTALLQFASNKNRYIKYPILLKVYINHKNLVVLS